MFNPNARISSKAEHDRLLRLHAIEEAGALFRKHGDAAIAIVSVGRLDQSKTAEERRYDRLIIVELERLERVQRNAMVPMVMPAREPRRIGRARIAALLAWLTGRRG
jgi:hypothetical protein